jgi:hypothetical protein
MRYMEIRWHRRHDGTRACSGCCLAGEAVQAREMASQGEEAEVWIL